MDDLGAGAPPSDIREGAAPVGRPTPVAVALGGAGAFLIGLAATRLSGLTGDPRAWLLVGLVVAGEAARPWFARGHDHGIAVTTPFLMALLLVVGAPLALVTQALGGAAVHVATRSLSVPAVLALGRRALALGVASAIAHLIDAGALVGAGGVAGDAILGAFGVAGAVFLSDRLLEHAAGRGLRPPLRQGLAPRDSEIVLLALVPLTVFTAQSAAALLPLLALPIVLVAKAGGTSLENHVLIERLRSQAAEKEHQALHDGLTGLPNRTLFRDRVHQAVAAARRESSGCAVLIMDLDRFKEVNETLGHHNGDQLLQLAGARLAGALRESDTIARHGGDEFAILLPHVGEANDAARAAEKILEALDDPITLPSLSFHVGSSIGIALFPDHGADADSLIQKADVAMYAAKELHSGYEIYAPEQDKYSPDRLALVGELRQALERRELVLVYQPKALLPSGNVEGVEALVRWDHPRRGLLPPNEFIPLAEHTGLIRPLTLQVLDTALGQCRRWRDEGLNLHVAVNLSVQSLLDAAFPNEVARLLSKWNVSPAWLELEITESGIMVDPFRALEVLTRLNHMGIRLAIDDYGTGYSSLAYLRQLPVNAIKIDKSFVLGMEASDNDSVIVRSTIDLGRNLGLEVVAEGVENENVWQRLGDLRCTFAQGYFLARPMPAEELSTMLREGPFRARVETRDLEALWRAVTESERRRAGN
ncbi:MAG TPA: EAL domain-containing protein [Actinomycetota bacterium]|nr:EAL domain-containing protein [Actinomycetota bacterium]